MVKNSDLDFLYKEIPQLRAAVTKEPNKGSLTHEDDGTITVVHWRDGKLVGFKQRPMSNVTDIPTFEGRVKASENYKLPIIADGSAWYDITDVESGWVIAQYRFPMPIHNGPLDKPEWFEAQKRIAQTIAEVLSEADKDSLGAIIERMQEALDMVVKAGKE